MELSLSSQQMLNRGESFVPVPVSSLPVGDTQTSRAPLVLPPVAVVPPVPVVPPLTV
jgi:hypothetical protein